MKKHFNTFILSIPALALSTFATPLNAEDSSPTRTPREAWFPIKVYGPNVRTSGEVLAGTSGTVAPPRNPDARHSLDTPFRDWWNGAYMLGGDGHFGPNIRGTMKDRGITFDGNYQGAFFGVVDAQGGSRGFWNQQLNASASINLGKLLQVSALQGTSLFGAIRYRDSWPESNPNEVVQANGMFNPSNWQSGTQFRLLNFGVEWDSDSLLAVDHMITLKGGWLQPQKEFLDQPLSKLFLNNAINSAKGIGGNIPFSSSFSSWGGVLTLRPLENLYTRHGLFMSFPDATATGNHGLAFEGFAQDPSRNGLFYMGEIGVTPLLGSAKLPGKYAFGGYFYGTPPMQTVSWNGTTAAGQYGFYFQADQMLYRAPAAAAAAPETPATGKNFKSPATLETPATSSLSNQGLKTFNMLTFAPGYAQANVFPFYFQSGLVYTGLLPARTADLTMIAFGYGAYQGGVTTPNQTYSAVLEGGYRFQVNGWSYAQPFFQYIIRPNGTQEVRNAGILGVLVGVVF